MKECRLAFCFFASALASGFQILCFIFIVLASVRSGLAAQLQLEQPNGQQLNVVVISIDDLNDWVGCLGGHPQVQTPNIDRLAASGMLFSNAHCQSPLCNPSRTSVMTGLRPSETGIYGLKPWFRQLPEFKNVVTWPQYFQRHGYQTFTFGKTYHDAYPPASGREDGAEFSHWGYHGSGGNPKPAERIVQMPNAHPLMDWGPFPASDDLQDDYRIATQAIDRLKALADAKEPFMLHCGFRRPHVPCFAPPKWFSLYPDDNLVMPRILENDRHDTPQFSWYLHWELPEPRLEYLQKIGQHRSLVRSYLASISFVDAMVGRVIDQIDASGLGQSTLVVLWSDHGYHLGEKQITGKNSLWERSTRVPLIIAGPGIRPGRCCEPVELLDLYPTTAEYCGLEQPKNQSGHSLVPQLREPNTKREFPAITTHNQGNHSVRDRRWRYIQYADGSEELYDMYQDENEWNNLIRDPQFAEEVVRLRAWLPKVDKPLAEGSQHRTLEWDGKRAIWEGKVIEDPTFQEAPAQEDHAFNPEDGIQKEH